MEDNKTGNSVMINIASFIVDKRLLFFLIYIIGLIAAIKVSVGAITSSPAQTPFRIIAR